MPSDRTIAPFRISTDLQKMMNAFLGFTRYHVRGFSKVKKETSILIMALNIMKLATSSRKEALKKHKKRFRQIFFSEFYQNRFF